MAPRLRSNSQRGFTVDDDSRSSSCDDNNGDQLQQQQYQDDDKKPLLDQSTIKKSSSTVDMISSSSNNIEKDRENHDYFNLVALLPVIITTAINWDFAKLFNGISPEEAYNGQYFYSNWTATLIYFIMDLIWVSKIRTCVKSPDTIIKVGLFLPEWGWVMGAILSVEANTWFLIFRRVSYKRSDIIPSFLCKIINFLFYITWIIVRIFIYPAILFYLLWIAIDDYIRNGLDWHKEYICVVVHSFLVVLNLKWSYDLFLPFFITTPSNNNKKGVTDGL